MRSIADIFYCPRIHRSWWIHYFQLVLSTMQVLLIAQEKLPLKESIAKILDSEQKINRVDIDPRVVILDPKKILTDCFIYVDRSPSRSILDKLHETKRPLILIADTHYPCHLFIPFDRFFDPTHLASFCENILNFTWRSDIDYQRNLLPDNRNNANKRHSSTSANQQLTDIEKQVFNSWINRENRIIAASRLNISLRTYHRTLEKAKHLSGLPA